MRPLILAVLLALPLPALAETREERIAVADEYVTLALTDFDMAAVIDTMWQPIIQQAEAAGQPVSPEQRDKIKALYTDAFTVPMTDLMKEQSAIMADVMTLAEITALRDFYATPEGRSAMAKLPQLTAAQQPGLMKLVNDKVTGLMPQVIAILNGEAPPAPTAQP
jgi:hypothetical protein